MSLGQKGKTKPQEFSCAEKIKRLRKEKKMTLKELGEKSGLSASFISLLERRKAQPTITSLMNLAKGLDVKLEYFFEPPKVSNLYHSADDPQYIDIDSPVTFIRLNAKLPDQIMDAILFLLPPGLLAPREYHHGEYFYYQIEGSTTFRVGDETFVLKPGDSLHFKSDVGYEIENTGDTTAKLLWVGSPVLFEND